jgi:nitrate reductase assembly molybdenum cofactor insertion protein NarJ
MEVRHQYSVLADLFRYPNEDYIENVNACSKFLEGRYPKAYQEMKPFLEFVNSNSLYEIEEVFGKTFHIQAICYLDMGYVLFAEDYKRGEFLVQMKNEQRKANNDCGVELADNLPNVLSLMAIMEDKEFLAEFAVRVVKVALDKMLTEFDESRIALKDKVRKKKQKVILVEDMQNKNIYQYALQAIYNVVNADYPDVKFNDPVIVPTLGGNVLGCATAECSTPSTPAETQSETTAG